jgi:hypothetical protein
MPRASPEGLERAKQKEKIQNQRREIDKLKRSTRTLRDKIKRDKE